MRNLFKSTFKTILSTSVIIIVGFSTANTSPAKAQMAQSEAYCDSLEGKPATVIDNNKGRKVAIIVWVKAFSSGWSPEARCGQVSTKFDSNIKSGNFKYIVSGQAPNGLPVLCASANKSTGRISCEDSKILMTLRSGDSPESVLAKLNAVNDGRNPEPLSHAYPLVNRFTLDLWKLESRSRLVR
jgi:hypothetical protein